MNVSRNRKFNVLNIHTNADKHVLCKINVQNNEEKKNL